MGISYWFRVSMMVVALAVVLVVMNRLNRGPASPMSRKASLATTVNICPTRITRLDTGKVSVFEEGLTWFRHTQGDGQQALDPVAVEKWFSRNCVLPAKRVSASADVHTALRISFVSGEPRTLLQSASGEYEWMGLSFSSQQMEHALEELLSLPPAPKSGH